MNDLFASVWMHARGRRWHQIFWNWSNKWWWATKWVLTTESGTSGDQWGLFNLYAISPILVPHFKNLILCVWVLDLRVSMCTTFVPDAHGRLEEAIPFPRTRVTGGSKPPCRCLGIKPRTSEKTASTLNYRDISPALCSSVLNISL